ncbi:MAG: type II toxin-antitoxin system RelE/ParE family toxin [Oxalobacter sp.]|nr:type II toxin-antitoxin system RelE/ParE family toxin [Oxalobacter sp.]
MKIVYTLKAKQDLQDIYEYIAYTLLAPETARRMTGRIMKAVRSLESLPQRNPLYKEEPWHSQGLRFLPVKNYLIFYIVNTSTETVTIVRIMYGARDISRQLEGTIEQ